MFASLPWRRRQRERVAVTEHDGVIELLFVIRDLDRVVVELTERLREHRHVETVPRGLELLLDALQLTRQRRRRVLRGDEPQSQLLGFLGRRRRVGELAAKLLEFAMTECHPLAK